MKQTHLRKEKTCLNCGATVEDRFCPHCGQQNINPKESFRHLLGHFMSDITHFDSKLLSTIKDLLFRPGFLTAAYISGKRLAYLNPIRIYVFISALFFLIMFWGKSGEDTAGASAAGAFGVSVFRQHLADSLRKVSQTTDTATLQGKGVMEAYQSLANRLDTVAASRDSTESIDATINDEGEIIFILKDDKYARVNEYVADQLRLPADKRDNFFMRYMTKKLIFLTHEKYQKPQLVVKRNVEHDIPKIMFVLLPVFALFVGFFYTRKKYWYTQHIIFSLHFNSFVFIVLILAGLVAWVIPMDKMWQALIVTELACIFIYLGVGLHRVYGQSPGLSFAKALGISILYIMAIMVSIVILICFSFILLQ